MPNYNFEANYRTLLQPDIVSLLLTIREYKGEQNLFIEAQADTLAKLVEVAKIQSTEASNKIEGIYTANERLQELMAEKTAPKTRSEQEIAGYRDVLNTIHGIHDYRKCRKAPAFRHGDMRHVHRICASNWKWTVVA